MGKSDKLAGLLHRRYTVHDCGDDCGADWERKANEAVLSLVVCDELEMLDVGEGSGRDCT